jgi:23S rRNA pseudouridine1911/1915/1917 synthase
MKRDHSLEVLYEDQWIIIVNKPAGMLSVGYPGSSAKTAQDVLYEMYKSKGKVKIAVVHRLDRDTSGVMMFARTAEAKERFMNDWHEIVTERTYRCVCGRISSLGRIHEVSPLADAGVIDAPLAYNKYDVAYVPKTGDAKALKEAESAVTRYKVLARGKYYDLVECELETGRKNQIRAHMASLGHPVAGDEVYGKELLDSGSLPERGRRDSPDSAKGNPVGRLALHARVLAFIHPFTHQPHRVEVDEPAAFRIAVEGKRAPTAPQTGTGFGTNDLAKERKTSAGSTVAREGQTPSKSRVTAKAGAPAYPKRERKENIEDLTDLKPARRASRTRQDSGKSKFIPGK